MSVLYQRQQSRLLIYEPDGQRRTTALYLKQAVDVRMRTGLVSRVLGMFRKDCQPVCRSFGI
jgi:hypothetical protein